MVLVFILSSCGKEKFYRYNSEITGKWEVRDFISLESMAYEKNDDYNPVIEFKEEGIYNLTLDVNTCTGKYHFNENDELEFAAVGCTKMCCDSPFSKKLTEMLPRITSYSIDKNDLRLNVPGWGWITLKRILD